MRTKRWNKSVKNASYVNKGDYMLKNINHVQNENWRKNYSLFATAAKHNTNGLTDEIKKKTSKTESERVRFFLQSIRSVNNEIVWTG